MSIHDAIVAPSGSAVASGAAMLMGVTPEVAIAAFVGSVFFWSTSNDYALHKKAMFFLVSCVCGLLSAKTIAGLANFYLGAPIVDPAIGAFLTSAIVVKFLNIIVVRLDYMKAHPALPIFKKKGPPRGDEQ